MGTGLILNKTIQNIVLQYVGFVVFHEKHQSDLFNILWKFRISRFGMVVRSSEQDTLPIEISFANLVHTAAYSQFSLQFASFE